MFWDDEMVELAKSEYPSVKTQEGITSLAIKIYDLAWDKMKKEVLSNPNLTDYAQKAAVKKACILWKSAAIKMENAGYPVIEPDGFFQILKSKPDFEKYLPKSY